MEVNLESICKRYREILLEDPVPVVKYHINATKLSQEALLELCEVIPTLTDVMEANRLLGRLQAIMGVYGLIKLEDGEP